MITLNAITLMLMLHVNEVQKERYSEGSKGLKDLGTSIKSIELLFFTTLIWHFSRMRYFFGDKPFFFILVDCNIRKNGIYSF